MGIAGIVISCCIGLVVCVYSTVRSWSSAQWRSSLHPPEYQLSSFLPRSHQLPHWQRKVPQLQLPSPASGQREWWSLPDWPQQSASLCYRHWGMLMCVCVLWVQPVWWSLWLTSAISLAVWGMLMYICMCAVSLASGQREWWSDHSQPHWFISTEGT